MCRLNVAVYLRRRNFLRRPTFTSFLLRSIHHPSTFSWVSNLSGQHIVRTRSPCLWAAFSKGQTFILKWTAQLLRTGQRRLCKFASRCVLLHAFHCSCVHLFADTLMLLKVKLSPYLTTITWWRIRGVSVKLHAFLIAALVSITLWQIYPRGISPMYSLDRRLGEAVWMWWLRGSQ